MAYDNPQLILFFSALEHFNNGVVMTSEPLVDNELFEIRLDSTVPRWIGGLVIGATTKDPNSFSFPNALSEYKKNMYMWIGNKIKYGQSMEKDMKHNIANITVSQQKLRF